MIKEDFEKNLSSIEEKLGKENYGKIVGEMSILSKDNDDRNSEIENLKTKVQEEKENSNQYIQANAILMQQIGVQTNNNPNTTTQPIEKDPDEKKISWDQCFDKKGNFIN